MPHTMQQRFTGLRLSRYALFGTIWQVLLLIPLSAPTCFGQQTQTVPLPEYFGIYVVVDGALIQLDAQHVSAPSYETILMGHRSGVGNILQGQPVASSSQARIARFSPNLKIIVYSQKSGLESPLDTARSLHLEMLVFVRNLNVDTGWPNNVRRSGGENGWEAGDAPELLGMASGDHAKRLEFRIRPAPGRQDMVIAELADTLSPGVYSLRLGERNPWSNSSGLLFVVDPIAEGISRKCVDLTVRYSMNLSKNTYTPCGGNSTSLVAVSPSLPGTHAEVAANPPTREPCASAMNSYSLVFNGQSYRVLKLGPAGPKTPPVFFDRAGTQEKNTNLISHLTKAVWAHDNIVVDPSFRTQPRSQLLLNLIQTSIALQGYQHTQDLVVRSTVELLATAVSDGTAANPISVLKAALEAAKPDPTEWMGASAVVGLYRSVDRYRSLEKILDTLTGNEFDAAALEQMYNLYLEAWGLEQINRPVLVATEPAHWSDLAKQALWSAGSEALNVIVSIPAGATAGEFVQQVYDVTQSVQSAGEVNDLYKQWAQGIKFSHDYAAAVHRLLQRWIDNAAIECR